MLNVISNRYLLGTACGAALISAVANLRGWSWSKQYFYVGKDDDNQNSIRVRHLNFFQQTARWLGWYPETHFEKAWKGAHQIAMDFSGPNDKSKWQSSATLAIYQMGQRKFQHNQAWGSKIDLVYQCKEFTIQYNDYFLVKNNPRFNHGLRFLQIIDDQDNEYSFIKTESGKLKFGCSMAPSSEASLEENNDLKKEKEKVLGKNFLEKMAPSYSVNPSGDLEINWKIDREKSNLSFRLDQIINEFIEIELK